MEPILVYSFALFFYASLKTAEEYRFVFHLEQLRSKGLLDLLDCTTQHNGTRPDGILAGATEALLLR